MTTALPNISRITRCRACGNPELIPCLDIGDQYLSSIFPSNLDYRSEFQRYPLAMVLCDRKDANYSCGLLQLAYDLDLSEMYKAYPYTSSSNSSMRAVLEDVAASGRDLHILKNGDVILDIGCNDGTLLSCFADSPYEFLGIDAAQNITPVFHSPRFRMIRGFFSKKTFDSISTRKARLIFSIAMFYHLPDPVAFCRDAADCIEDDGAWIIQMAYLPAMIKTQMYDNIVHEHAGYYGIETMEWVLDQAGLEVFDVLTNDVYGGSFRLFVQKKRPGGRSKTNRYRQLLIEEREQRLFEPNTYSRFDIAIQKTRDDLRSLISSIRSAGKTIWIYGASTKGNTIVQYCGLTNKDIDAAADANPFKIGKYIIGCDVPIKDEMQMRKAKPDYLLSLPYSFTQAFMKRESDLVGQGTRFIVPLPQVRVEPSF